MFTVDQANAIAASWISSGSADGESRAIIESQTIERPYGWVFFYQSKRYLETRDPSDALAGNAPLIVDRLTGQVTVTGTAHPTEYYLAQYEAARNAGAA